MVFDRGWEERGREWDERIGREGTREDGGTESKTYCNRHKNTDTQIHM